MVNATTLLIAGKGNLSKGNHLRGDHLHYLGKSEPRSEEKKNIRWMNTTRYSAVGSLLFHLLERFSKRKKTHIRFCDSSRTISQHTYYKDVGETRHRLKMRRDGVVKEDSLATYSSLRGGKSSFFAFHREVFIRGGLQTKKKSGQALGMPSIQGSYGFWSIRRSEKLEGATRTSRARAEWRERKSLHVTLKRNNHNFLRSLLFRGGGKMKKEKSRQGNKQGLSDASILRFGGYKTSTFTYEDNDEYLP